MPAIDGLSDAAIRDVLDIVRRIALVGASPKPNRTSHGVMKTLLVRGYDVVPVNPQIAGATIHGRTVAATLADVAAPIDMVDIFRNSDAAGETVAEAIALKEKLAIRVVWMQLGIINESAASAARAAGLTVVMDRCPVTELGRLG